MYKYLLYALTYVSLAIMVASLIFILSVTFEVPYQVPWPAVITTGVAFLGVLTAFVLNNHRISRLKAEAAAAELSKTNA